MSSWLQVYLLLETKIVYQKYNLKSFEEVRPGVERCYKFYQEGKNFDMARLIKSSKYYFFKSLHRAQCETDNAGLLDPYTSSNHNSKEVINRLCKNQDSRNFSIP